MDIVEIKGRMDLARARRRPYEPPVQEISDLAMPYRGDIVTHRDAGTKGENILNRGPGVFDSTGTLAADSFTNFLKAMIFPSTHPWMKLGLPERFDRSVLARSRADITARRMHRAIARSNFYNVADAWVADDAVLGTGTLYGEEFDPIPENADGSTFGGFRFTAVPWGRMWFLMGIESPVFIVRDLEMPAINAKREFGDAGVAGEKAISSGNPMELFTYSNVQWLNENGIPGGIHHPLDKPWISLWVVEPTSEGLQVLRTRGQDLPSYMIGRWMVRDGEEQGRGQGFIARPDMKGVNKLKEMTLDAAGVDLKPPFLVEAETQIDLDLGPSGIIVMQPPVRLEPKFLPTGARYDVANAIGVEDRKNIKAAFLTDLIEDPQFQDRTAEAVRDRQIRVAQRLSPRADKVYHEMVAPLVVFVMHRMSLAGDLPELQQLIEMGVDELEIVPTSPFFTAQKAAPLTRMRAFIEEWKRDSVEAGRPDILDAFNYDRAIDLSAQLSDMPAEILNTKEERDAIRQARFQQEQRQRAIDQTEQLASAAGDLKGAQAV